MQKQKKTSSTDLSICRTEEVFHLYRIFYLVTYLCVHMVSVSAIMFCFIQGRIGIFVKIHIAAAGFGSECNANTDRNILSVHFLEGKITDIFSFLTRAEAISFDSVFRM